MQEIADQSGVKRIVGQPDKAEYMSTHAIKTELRTLIGELAPEVAWSKRVTVTELAVWAVAQLDADSHDPRVQRARELAQVIYGNQRR
ncbi:hypothetical protein ACIQMV_39105 [Streptomyces sp. NPDC091412]|uniref:hypothetical protein n=1 Tax=Streptomyces sp. NPDC091412 TaxID=3366002 RepID=UPI0037FF61AB